MKPVLPTFIDYECTSVSHSYDSIRYVDCMILALAWGQSRATLFSLPPFIPNDYLFETHKDKGADKWEIYAWAVRDAMVKAAKKEDLPN